MVTIPLSLNPRAKYKIIMFHFYWQKSPSVLHRQSIEMITNRVFLNPIVSPKRPQKGAPKTAEIVTDIAHKDK